MKVLKTLGLLGFLVLVYILVIGSLTHSLIHIFVVGFILFFINILVWEKLDDIWNINTKYNIYMITRNRDWFKNITIVATAIVEYVLSVLLIHSFNINNYFDSILIGSFSVVSMILTVALLLKWMKTNYYLHPLLSLYDKEQDVYVSFFETPYSKHIFSNGEGYKYISQSWIDETTLLVCLDKQSVSFVFYPDNESVVEIFVNFFDTVTRTTHVLNKNQKKQLKKFLNLP